MAAATRALAFEKAGDDRAVQMRARYEIGDWHAGLERTAAEFAGGAHQPAHCLDREVERKLVRIRAGAAKAGSRGVDQPRIRLQEDIRTKAEARHDCRGEVLHQHVGLAAQFDQQLLAALGSSD